MVFRVKVLIAFVLVTAVVAATTAAQCPGQHWERFALYLVAILLTSGMKVSSLKGDSTASVNFPFILLAIVQLSVPQAMALAAIAVFAQCNFRVRKVFTLVQIAFNIATAANATAAAWLTYTLLLRLHLSIAPALSLAAVVYFLSNTVPVSLVIGWTKKEKISSIWAANFSWYLPFYLVGAALSALGNFLSLRYGWPTSLLVVPVVYTMYRSYNGQVARLRDNEKHLEEVEDLHLRTIEGLAMAIEAKDQNTHDHLLRVRVYVSEIGQALQLNKSEMQAVVSAALLHDIGKLAVPEYILNKPGKLTQEEFEKMKTHPAVGADILGRVHFPYPVVPIVRSHHEWWNGMGYPDGLAGEAIPIGARILTVVDCFDALASDRPYRRAMPIEKAMAMVKELAGTQFDPRVVEVMEQHYIRLEELARHEGEKLKRLNTEIVVDRGLAPGAGFEQDSVDVQKEHAHSAANVPSSTSAPLHSGLEAVKFAAAAREQAQIPFAMSRLQDLSLSLDETILVMSSRLRGLFPFDCCIFYWKIGDTVVPLSLSSEAGQFFSSAAIPQGQGISGWVAQNIKPIVNGNATVEPNYLLAADAAHGLHSALSVPLLDHDGSVFYVLSLYALASNAFSRDHLRVLQALEAKLSLMLQNAMDVQLTGNDDQRMYMQRGQPTEALPKSQIDLPAELEIA